MRKRCNLCSKRISIDYKVPQEIWQQVVPKGWENKKLCIDCFGQLGDEKRVKWEHGIEIFPISLKTFLEAKLSQNTD